MSGAQPTFQTAEGAFLLFPTEQRGESGFAGGLAPVRQQPVQIERRGTGALSGSVIGWVLELVVGFERVWSHRPVARLDMRGQHHGDGRVTTVLLALALQREAHRVRVRYIAYH